MTLLRIITKDQFRLSLLKNFMFTLITSVFIVNLIMDSSCFIKNEVEETVELSEKLDFDEKKEKDEQIENEQERFFQEIIAFSPPVKLKEILLEHKEYNVLDQFLEVFTPPPELV